MLLFCEFFDCALDLYRRGLVRSENECGNKNSAGGVKSSPGISVQFIGHLLEMRCLRTARSEEGESLYRIEDGLVVFAFGTIGLYFDSSEDFVVALV